jgi:diaminohydroxyphosphoribosylaminopyrimidine deaminase / 5-amino-6-(5-phosphoribosylamino)uracil reductase
MLQNEFYIHRCLQLAAKAVGRVAPNPMVGSVLVYNNTIIGEGWHEQYGQAHAEVNCINSVAEHNKPFIKHATLYVSLEPCNHFGKTPPCSHLIVQQQIKKVLIGCTDSFDLVNGSGIAYLRQHGVDVQVGIIEQACKEINKRFFTFHQQKKPFVWLKWAQTQNGFIGNTANKRLLISNELTQKLVHQFRSNEAAILVGANTIVKDNPLLNNRLFGNKQPIKIVIAGNRVLPNDTAVFKNNTPTIIFTKQQQQTIIHPTVTIKLLNNHISVLQQVMQYCYNHGIQSILVEGGAYTLQQFINENLWNEAVIITNQQMHINDGIKAPTLVNALPTQKINLLNDSVQFYKNNLFV